MRPILRVALPAALLAIAAIGCVYEGVPLIVKHPESVFAYEGQTVTFEVEATGSVPANPYAYQWRRSDDAGATFDDLPGATTNPFELPAVTLADHDARFRVLVTNGYGSALSNPAQLVVESCPVPPLPDLESSEPQVVGPPAATLNANLLANPFFEGTVWVGLQPTGFGYWRFDESASVTAQQGVVPRSEDAMMQFASASRDVTLFGSANGSEQVQVVDVNGVQGSPAAQSRSTAVKASGSGTRCPRPGRSRRSRRPPRSPGPSRRSGA